MAKMFYSAQEAAGKLGKSVDELMAMAKSGEVQSFKQDDQDMFRVEQIDMISSTDDLGDLSINLDDSGEADSLGLSGSAPGIDGDEVSLEMSGEIGLEDSTPAGPMTVSSLEAAWEPGSAPSRAKPRAMTFSRTTFRWKPSAAEVACST